MTLEEMKAASPRKVRVGGIVVAKLGALPPAVECKVEAIINAMTDEKKTEADLAAVRLLCSVVLRPSGRTLTGPDDMSTGPWEPGESRTVLLPVFIIERVVSEVYNGQT